MKLDQWLESETGRARSMALHFGISESAANQWKTNGVPKGRIKAVSRFTGGAVSVEEMLPDEPLESKGITKGRKHPVKLEAEQGA